MVPKSKPKKPTKQKSVKISCTYHVFPHELNSFEEFVTRVNAHARNGGLPAMDKGQVMGQIMGALKRDEASLKKFLKND